MTARSVLLGLIAASALCGSPAQATETEIVVVVAANSPIPRLSDADIADIFLGRLTRLPDGTRVVALDRQEDRTREAFYLRVARMTDAQLRAYWSRLIFTGRGRPPRAVGSDEDVLRAVRADPKLIGYVDRSQVDHTVRVLR